MPAYPYFLILIATIIWFYPFVPAHQNTPGASVVNRRSRWGVLLQFTAFAILWCGPLLPRSIAWWRLAVSIALFLLAILLSWTSSRALAGQLRIDAALGADHRLVRSGPYAIVRNPIYTSMLLVLCAVGVVVTPWKRFLPALVLLLAGTEIRVRTEEKLLESRFAEEFRQYKRAVRSYIPFLY